MNTEIPPPEIQEVRITEDALTFDLLDGRSISVPLAFYPTLMLATREEREVFEKTGSSVHWPVLDCDINSEALLRGAKEAAVYAKKAYERAREKGRSAA
jgi:Protein of unknown function (DUF2442)